MIRVIRHHTSTGVLPLLFSEIALLFACFYASSEILYAPSGWDYLVLDGGLPLVAIAIGTIILAMYFFDMYAEVQVTSRIVLLQQLCQSLGVAILAQTVAAYLFRDWTVPHFMMLYSSGFALVTLFFWRLLFSKLVQRIGVHDKLLFLGRSETTAEVARAIEANPKAGYRVIGFLDDQSSGAGVLGGVSALRATVAEYKPSLLVVGMAGVREAMPVADLVALRFAGLQIEEASQTFESVYQRVRVADLSAQQVMFSRTFHASSGSLRVARLTSIVLALLCVLLFLPLTILIAAWLLLSSREPMIVELPREGQDGCQFLMLRFRREPSLKRLFDRFRLNALPELINVLRGEMSLVGPYPETPEKVRELSGSLPFYSYRTSVPPGMTGWAQINLSPENRSNRALGLEYDLYYIKHTSLALNLYILVHALKNRILRP